VSQAALDDGIGEKLKLSKSLSAVRGIRTVRKKDMIHNGLTPKLEVDPQTYEVRVDGVVITCEPADVLPMAQRYFLF
jgi:urease subunit alpha